MYILLFTVYPYSLSCYTSCWEFPDVLSLFQSSIYQLTVEYDYILLRESHSLRRVNTVVKVEHGFWHDLYSIKNFKKRRQTIFPGTSGFFHYFLFQKQFRQYEKVQSNVIMHHPMFLSLQLLLSALWSWLNFYTVKVLRWSWLNFYTVKVLRPDLLCISNRVI